MYECDLLLFYFTCDHPPISSRTKLNSKSPSISGGRLDTSPDPQHNPIWNSTEGPMDRQEHKVERRLAAIFAADVAGYSRLMEQDEVGTLRTLTAHREIMDGLIAEHGGRIANTAGDSVLAEFPSAVDAVQCAVAVQEALAQTNEDAPEERRSSFGSESMSVM